jgi:hypothetical protein
MIIHIGGLKTTFGQYSYNKSKVDKYVITTTSSSWGKSKIQADRGSNSIMFILKKWIYLVIIITIFQWQIVSMLIVMLGFLYFASTWTLDLQNL